MTPCAKAQLVADPNDLKIWVQWLGPDARNNNERVAGPAKLHIEYTRPSGADISFVKARLSTCNIVEVSKALPDMADPSRIWIDDEDHPTFLEMATGPNGVYGSMLEKILPWPTLEYHNGKHSVDVGLSVSVHFTNGQTQVLLYNKTLGLKVRNLTIDDLTGVAPLPSTGALSMMGEPTSSDTSAPVAQPYFIHAAGTSETLTCVVNTVISGGVHLRYEILSCDNPDEVLMTHETDVASQGLQVQPGPGVPTVNTWTWDGTKTVYQWDEWENYYEEQVPVPRGLYQVRITAEMVLNDGESSSSGSSGGYGSLTDTDCTRFERTRWPMAMSAYGLIYPAYLDDFADGKRKLKVSYALQRGNGNPYYQLDAAEEVCVEAFTRVYDGAAGALEKVAGPVAGLASIVQSDCRAATAENVALDVLWTDKDNRAEKILATAKDKGGYDRGHREKWNLGLTRKVIDGETEMVIYQQTQPATSTAPEGLRRVTGNQIVGGRCYVGVEMELSPNAYLYDTSYMLRVSEDPDAVHGIEHGVVQGIAQDHVSYLIMLESEFAIGASIYETNPYINYANAPRWQKWNSALQRWDNATTSPHYYRSARREYWRVLIPWQTSDSMQWYDNQGHTSEPYSRLLGHNGAHTIKLHNINAGTGMEQTTSQSTFVCDEVQVGQISHNYGMFHTIEIDRAQDKANVQNLVITKCEASDHNEQGAAITNPDYLKFDPESTDWLRRHPQITFEIKDEGDPHRYRWWLWLKPTREEQNSVQFSGIMSSPGSKTITVNPGTPEAGITQDHALEVWGTYTFEMRVEEIKDDQEVGLGDPWQELRSAKLFIPPGYNDPQTGQWTEGHSLSLESVDAANDQSQLQAKVSYYLEDTPNEAKPPAKDATIGDVKFLDGIMQERDTLPLKPEIRTPREDGMLHTFSDDDEAGEYRAIFMAEDAHAVDYRDHKNKRMMPTNQKGMMKIFHIEDDWMTKGSPYSNDYLNPLAHDGAINGAFMRPDPQKVQRNKEKKATPSWGTSSIIWKALYENSIAPNGFREINNGHFATGDTGPLPPSDYRPLRAKGDFTSDCGNFSNAGFNPPGGVSRFAHYYQREGAGSNVSHAYARYVHFIGAGTRQLPNGTFAPDHDFWGLTSPVNSLGARWSFSFVEEIHLKSAGEGWEANVNRVHHAIVKNTIHELGHQFSPTEMHEHDLVGDTGATGQTEYENAEEEWRTAFYAHPRNEVGVENAMKKIRLFKGRLLTTLTPSGHIRTGNAPYDYEDCVMLSDLDSGYVFCDYHKHIINQYTGW